MKKYYHGSSSSFDKPANPYDVSSPRNIFGEGLYTTSDQDVAMEYTKKGKGTTPGVMEVNPASEIKAYNMHDPLSPELVKHITESLDTYDGGYVLDNVPKPATMFDVLNEVRAESRNINMPDYEYQDFVHGVKEPLREQGYNALEHRGGVLTGNKPHTVTIFDNPVQDVSVNRIKQIEPASLEHGYSEPVTKFTNWAGEMGSTTAPALIDLAILEGGTKALSIPSLNEGEDEKMQQINALNKQKYLESLSRGPSSESAQDIALRQFAPEIQAGKLAKQKYLEQIQLKPSDVNFTNAEYEHLADKAGIVPYAFEQQGIRTDSPGYTAEQTGRNPLLTNKPIYEELLKQLNQ